jgi:hypothetical protein
MVHFVCELARGVRVIVQDPYVKVKVCTILRIIVYHSTLVASMLVKLFVKNVEKKYLIIFSKTQNFAKEFFLIIKILYYLTWNFQI